MPEPWYAMSATVRGEDYYFVYGPIDPPLAVPSGPPVYVFTPLGELIDWAMDSGEAPKFNLRWTPQKHERIEIEALDSILIHDEPLTLFDPFGNFVVKVTDYHGKTVETVVAS